MNGVTQIQMGLDLGQKQGTTNPFGNRSRTTKNAQGVRARSADPKSTEDSTVGPNSNDCLAQKPPMITSAAERQTLQKLSRPVSHTGVTKYNKRTAHPRKHATIHHLARYHGGGPDRPEAGLVAAARAIPEEGGLFRVLTNARQTRRHSSSESKMVEKCFLMRVCAMMGIRIS